jgi:hypothetical protein
VEGTGLPNIVDILPFSPFIMHNSELRPSTLLVLSSINRCNIDIIDVKGEN